MNASVAIVPLGDAVKPTRPRVKPADFSELPFIGMEHIEAHSMKLLGTARAGTMKSSAVHFKPGDVLYGRLRPYLNKVYRPSFEGLCSAEFIVLPESDRVDGAYLQYCLNSGAFVRYSTHLNAGDRPRVDFDQLAAYKIPLPGIDDQRRAVAEIEKQYSRLDEAVANLKRVKTKLKRYRAAVFSAAVEGRLVATEAELARRERRSYETGEQLLDRIKKERRTIWDMRNAGARKKQYLEPVPPDKSALPELPEGWTWATWDQIGLSQNGRAFPSADYSEAGVKLLRPGNLHEGGRLVWSAQNARYMPERYEQQNADLVVRGRELIMNLTAQSLRDDFLGRICLTDVNEHCLLNQRLARLTPVLVSPEFALVVFKSNWFRRFVAELNTGSLIQHMFTSQLARFAVPLPPLAEQQRILFEVNRKMSIIEEIEIQMTRSETRCQFMRQAILVCAFGASTLA